MSQAESERREREAFEALEKTGPQFIISLQNEFDSVRAALNGFVARYQDIDPEDRADEAQKIWARVKSLLKVVKALARSYNDDALDIDIAREVGRMERESGTAGGLSFGLFIDSCHQLLASALAFLFRHNLLLTLQPVPPDFSADLIEQVVDELNEWLDDEFEKQLQATMRLAAATERAKLHELDRFVDGEEVEGHG